MFFVFGDVIGRPDLNAAPQKLRGSLLLLNFWSGVSAGVPSPPFAIARRLCSGEPPAPTRSAPRPNPGGCGFAQARRLVDCCVARYVRSFTAALPLSRRARRASLGQHYGPIGLVCEPDDAPSRGTRGLVLGSPETSSRKSSFGSCGDYKGSPPFPPWRCRADCRAGMALLVSWAAATIMLRGSSARKWL